MRNGARHFRFPPPLPAAVSAKKQHSSEQSCTGLAPLKSPSEASLDSASSLHWRGGLTNSGDCENTQDRPWSHRKRGRASGKKAYHHHHSIPKGEEEFRARKSAPLFRRCCYSHAFGEKKQAATRHGRLQLQKGRASLEEEARPLCGCASRAFGPKGQEGHNRS